MTGPPNLCCERPSHTDRHFVSTASCVKTILVLPTKKIGCHEIEKNISSVYENLAIFSRCKLLIVLELLHLKMEVTVSEPCDVIRVDKDYESGISGWVANCFHSSEQTTVAIRVK